MSTQPLSRPPASPGGLPAYLQGFADPISANRIARFAEVLSRFPVGRLVDLGAGHGMFARVAADLGWTVTAIDARDERFPVDGRIRWVKDDIRAFRGSGEYDLVACLGLWYHLTLPDQLALAKACAPLPLLVDTHVAVADLAQHRHAKWLSKVVEVDGWVGRYYSETGWQGRTTASYGNSTSFWPDDASLERMLVDAGYDTVDRIGPAVLPDRWFHLAQAHDPQEQARLRAVAARWVRDGEPRPEIAAPARTLRPTPSWRPDRVPDPVARQLARLQRRLRREG